MVQCRPLSPTTMSYIQACRFSVAAATADTPRCWNSLQRGVQSAAKCQQRMGQGQGTHRDTVGVAAVNCCAMLNKEAHSVNVLGSVEGCVAIRVCDIYVAACRGQQVPDNCRTQTAGNENYKDGKLAIACGGIAGSEWVEYAGQQCTWACRCCHRGCWGRVLWDGEQAERHGGWLAFDINEHIWTHEVIDAHVCFCTWPIIVKLCFELWWTSCSWYGLFNFPNVPYIVVW